jgi:outer membrane usher protein
MSLFKSAKYGLSTLFLSLLALSNGVKAEEKELHLDVIINEQPRKLIGRFRENEAGLIFADAKELRDIGLKTPKSAKDSDKIALNSLQGVTYRYDMTLQNLKITANEEALEVQIYQADQFAEREKTIVARDFGAVFNYSLYSSLARDFNLKAMQFSGVSGTVDSRFFGPLGTVATAYMVGNATTIKRAETIRLDSTWSYSNPDTLTTYRAGDVITGGHNWTRPVRLGGGQIARNYGLRPDLNTTALPGVAGSAAVPSMVDIFVNNRKTYSQEVGAGPFQIANLPMLGANGMARVVVTDPSGRMTETTQSFFAHSRLLAPGTLDYSVQAGYPRLEYGVSSQNYSNKLSAVASSRYGLNNSLTLEAHGETSDKFINIGAGFVTSLLKKHLFTVAGQISQFNGLKGGNIYASYESQWSDSFFFSAAIQRSFGDYYDLAAVTARPLTYQYLQPFNPFITPAATTQNTSYNAANQSLLPARTVDRVTIGIPLSFLDNTSLSASYIHLLTAEKSRSHLINISLNKSFRKGVSAFLSLFADRGDNRNYGFYAGLTVPFGQETSTSYASLGVTSDRNGSYATADYVKPLGHETDSWGYRFRDVEGSISYRSAAVSNRNRYFKSEITATQFKSGLNATAYLEGGLAIAGGGAFLTNRIEDSFAVVKAGVPNVEVFNENRLIGRTNAAGKILIPYLRSNENNRISLNPVDLPLKATVETTKTLAVPADRGVSVIDFGVDKNPQSATIIFALKDGKAIPAGTVGQIGDKDFIVGYDGRAFVTGLAASNSASFMVRGQRYQASFAYHPSEDVTPVIGPVICEYTR